MIRRVLRDRERSGGLDLEAVEMAVRSCMLDLGGKLLEELVNADGGGYRGPTIDCGQGHSAKFVEYRTKKVHSVLAPISVQRAYYHCATCHAGVVPKDQTLDLISTTFSPGARRLMERVGGQASFGKGQVNLEELADLHVKLRVVFLQETGSSLVIS